MKKMSRFHAVLSFTGLTLLAVFGAAVILHFSWNMVAPDLFGAAEMSFKNAFGLVIFLVTAAALVGRSASVRRSHFSTRVTREQERATV
jgi:hypothetical protein